jgi:hypothetical protein
MKRLVLLACCAMLLAVPATTQAQVAFGPQLSWGSDSDFGVGARAVIALPELLENFEAIISGDYFFIDCPSEVDCSFIEFNINGAIPLDVSPTLNPYVGAGLNIARASVEFEGFDHSDTEVGINLLGGLKFPTTSFTPFIEARLSIGGAEQFVLTGGILLGGRR